jgi:DNA helicase-2/ATP-dependent DNA helicase PcrA
MMRERAHEDGMPLIEVLAHDRLPARVPAAVKRGLRILAERTLDVAAWREQQLTAVVEQAIVATRADLAALGEDGEATAENLDELLGVAQEVQATRGSLRDLVDRLTVEPDERSRAGEVQLLSLHAAKGLEFQAVFVIGLEEGLLPHRRSLDRDEDIEEERRLAYVGMTRARDLLYLSHAHMRFLGGQALVGAPSRFLGEIGTHHLEVEISERTTARPRLATVAAGERVHHQRWGAGTVLSVEGKGRDTLTTIRFDTVGTQRLQLCHAPLRREPTDEDRSRVG